MSLAQELHEAKKREDKRIRDRNYRFRKATRSKRKVAVAKDVIKLLDSGKLHATRGIYFKMERNAYSPFRNLNVRAAASTPGVVCQVCAIGAVFAAAMLERGVDGEQSCVASYDSTRLSLFRNDLTDELTKADVFTDAELSRLENFFEVDAYELGLTPADGLRRAMEHIIETDGREVVPRKTPKG